ncbi:MAG: efflux RND transporter periplasmic adaptor subunit [Raineya sp.]
MNHKNVYIATSSVFALFLIATWLVNDRQGEQEVTLPVRQGVFEILVIASGELEAQNSIKITAPEDALRSAKVYQVKIADLVPEGTFVKKGDYVATLDKMEMSEKLRVMEGEMAKLRNQFNQIRLDTSLILRTERSELTNWSFLVKEKEAALRANQFEAPAQVKQLQAELEKAKRGYEQAKEAYRIKQLQAIAKIAETEQALAQEEYKYQEIKKLTESFVVTAPADGLVIYHRDWNGQKKTIGSYVSAWDAVVATLPDMQAMVSRAYVNEIDISKVKVGQAVKVKVDALPQKTFEGEVISISNIGEQRPESQVRVFEVKIKLKETHEVLKPTMTTSNIIICETIPNSLYIPLDCLHQDSQETKFVYLKKANSIIRQEVKVGKSNENEIIVTAGLNAKDVVYLSVPEKAKNTPLQKISNP